MTPLLHTLAALSRSEDAYLATADENWLQGRTIYGGLIGALSVAAARAELPGLPPLRSAQFVFVGPAAGPVSLHPQLLRQGRSASFVSVDVMADGALSARALLTFAAPRQSRHSFQDLPAPTAPPPDKGFALFDAPGAPRSTSNFDGRFVGGGIPFSGAARPELLLWLRHKNAAPHDEAALVALADASPPAVFPIFAQPAPISTVNWSIDLFAEPPPPTDWLLTQTSSTHVQDGTSVQLTRMWTADGAPILEARQLVALYD
ncbi:thioesterase family protein [Sandaracinobacter neustonicus]|uniref:Thioesterase family protein n=1 Tax=Sandaracinobacter neustonicus TaxID=1715348 RepID=A0A501XTE8_9SPHN|nr:thioesterase family protein [Sandaracinobacter neustonicus]TPE63931.1 thioesterase family protein [Sandaracinobacter neustonicus]